MEPTRPFPSLASSLRRWLMPTDMEVASSPILVTLLPLPGCTFPIEITRTGHAGLPDPQMLPAADCLLRNPDQGLQPQEKRSSMHCSFLLSPPRLHTRDSVPLRQGRGGSNHSTSMCIRSPLRDRTAPTELLLRSRVPEVTRRPSLGHPPARCSPKHMRPHSRAHQTPGYHLSGRALTPSSAELLSPQP